MNRIVATMDDLPELPFEKMLSYLSLEDRLKARAVSRRWYHQINSIKVKTLFCSKSSSGFIIEKGRLVSCAFAQNFIRSTRFPSFFNTFSLTILSNLKRLRICQLRPKEASTFVSTLNLFSRLEELDLINFSHPKVSGPDGEVELNLPMLTSIHLVRVEGIDQLTLDAPKLKKIKLLECSSLRLEIVHADSVEWLATDEMAYLTVENLKNLKCLHCEYLGEIDATFLSGLEQLKEVHLLKRSKVPELFEQKQRYDRTDLKIFLGGLLLNSPEDPTIDSFVDFNSIIVHLAKNLSRPAGEIPLREGFSYTALDGVTPGSAINLLNRMTDLNRIVTESSIPTQDVQRFLDLLKNLPNIIYLQFSVDQPQDLFDRLPEHSAVQVLGINSPVSDFRFLFRLEHLMLLQYSDQITAEAVRKAFEELQFFSVLNFKHHNQNTKIAKETPNRWRVLIGEKKAKAADLNAAIELVFGRTPLKKRKADELLK